MTDDQSTTTVNPQHLYRLYDASGTLLYIGISKSAIARLPQHLDTQHWANEIRHQHVEPHYVTRRELEQIERDAITAEKPKYNIIHNGKVQRAAKPNTGFRCEVCRKAAAYVQADMYENWHAFCKTHDDGCERYFIEAHRIATPEQVAQWTQHLAEKRWFDHYSWNRLVKSCGPKGAK
jgi:predicted GIY-YIG superfamily endonuclease